jgi:exosortase/archaeosortase family protein
MKQVLKNPAVAFATRFIVLFAGLYGFYLIYLGIISPGNIYSPFLDHNFNFISGLRHLLINTSVGVLHLLGYTTKATDVQLMVPAHNIIIIGYDCLGFGVMCFFTAFVLAYPKSLRLKMIFITIGLLTIQLLNVCRFVWLTLYWHHSRVYIADQHTVFNLVIYALIMVSLYFWIKTPKPVHDD